MKQPIHYKEVQQFRQDWIWYLMISGAVISLLPLIVFTISGEVPLDEGLAVLGGVVLVNVINMAAFYYVRLEIVMSAEGIAYRWWPFFRKYTNLNWNDVHHIELKKYSKFKFGYHKDKNLGKVHFVDGKAGYQVVMNDGRSYFFSTGRKLTVETVLALTGKLQSK